MIGKAAFLIIVWATAAFLANRLYVIIRYRELNVRGAIYSKAKTPFMYWAEIAIILFGLVLTGGMAVGASLYDAGLLA